VDPELGVDVGQVALDGAVADEEPPGDLRRREALGGEAGHLRLPGGQRRHAEGGVRRPPAGPAEVLEIRPKLPVCLAPSQMCYACRMGEVASRELRNDTRGLLRRVEAGEDVVITVDGRPVAVLRPVGPRPRWVSRGEFTGRLLRQADPPLAGELRALAPDTTDDLGW
jgi:prevent-host-death family protein